MQNQDINRNAEEEKIREFRLEASPIITWLQAVFYTLGIVTLIRLFFNQEFWGNSGSNLIFAIGTLIALGIVYLRLRKKED